MKARTGYTLFELILVMAVIVVATGISFPLAKGYLTDSHVQAAADSIRSQWAKMRAKAIEEGRPYELKYMEGDNKFTMKPWQAPGSNAGDTKGQDLEISKEVKVVIDNSQGSNPTGSAGIIYPDGTAQGEDDIIVIVSEKDGKGARVKLRLRPITGTVTSEKILGGKDQP
jgi:Tfp pilus assembly protein FimT